MPGGVGMDNSVVFLWLRLEDKELIMKDSTAL